MTRVGPADRTHGAPLFERPTCCLWCIVRWERRREFWRQQVATWICALTLIGTVAAIFAGVVLLSPGPR